MKSIVMQQCGSKSRKRNQRNEVAERMDHGTTTLKDGKYLEAKDIANEVLQKEKMMNLKKL